MWFSYLFNGVKKVLTERLCPACLVSFPGEGYDYAGRTWCSFRCVPAVLRDVKGDLQARARAAGIGAAIAIFLFASVAFAQTKPHTWKGATLAPTSAPTPVVSNSTAAAPMKPGEVREIGELAPYEWSPAVEQTEQETSDSVDYRIYYGGRQHFSHAPVHVHPTGGGHPSPAPHPAPAPAPIHTTGGISSRRPS